MDSIIVKQNGNALRFVKEQTQRNLFVVKQLTKWICITICWEQTEEICIEAVKQNGTHYNMSKNKLKKFGLLAVKQQWLC